MKVPSHLRTVGILALLLNAGGALDYTMTQLQVAASVTHTPPVQLAWIDAAPMWFEVLWGLSVWTAVLGAAALLARKRLAVPLFGLAVVGYAGASVYALILANPPMTHLMGQGALVLSLATGLSLLGLWLYARAMTERMFLR